MVRPFWDIAFSIEKQKNESDGSVITDKWISDNNG